jgi:hypothetical protein
MKGVVFVELLSMADEAVGEKAVDALVSRCRLASKGAYTSVGQYDCRELTLLVEALSSETSISQDELQRRFGHWMLRRFTESYGSFFEAKASAFEMLHSIEHEVHVEVRKLYSDAELPRFETSQPSPDTLILVYRSPRPLVHFCRGLIEACFSYYGEAVDLSVEDYSMPGASLAVFTLTQR